MSELYHITKKTANKKTGPIPVTTSPKSTCPEACPFRNFGCYGEFGPLCLHWRKVSAGERGLEWTDFIAEIRNLPAGQLWRHNQVGDLPGCGDKLNTKKVAQICEANIGKDGMTYTHYPVLIEDFPSRIDGRRIGIGESMYNVRHNQLVIETANKMGFTINLSANNLAHADKLVALNIGPVAAVVPADHVGNTETPNGTKCVECPAVRHAGVTCENCKLCANPNREYVIIFPAHGKTKRAASLIASN